MQKIKQTSPDKVNGKLVKYRTGDCLSFYNINGFYTAAFISEKFNKYYDLTLIKFYAKTKPTKEDFLNGCFFGMRLGSVEDPVVCTDRQMIECKYLDRNPAVEKIGELKLPDSITKEGYAYVKTIQDLSAYYNEELPIRVEKTSNAKKFPALAFASRQLIDLTELLGT